MDNFNEVQVKFMNRSEIPANKMIFLTKSLLFRQSRQMKYFQVNDHNHIRIVRIDRGKANPMNHDLVREAREIFSLSQDDEKVHGLILTGKEHFFSAGLDLIELYDYDRDKFSSFWEDFMAMVREMASFDKPFIASISGHSPAGGCVMAICADYRIMAEGGYRIGLNEVPVGIIVPPSVTSLYSFWLGDRQASEFLLTGKMHTVEEAHKCGLVDEVISYSKLEERCLEKMHEYLSFDQGAWRATKGNCRRELLREMAVDSHRHFDEGMEQWWRPEIRQKMREFIDNLKSRKA